MNRRSFFRSLALATAASASPLIFLPKLEPIRWKSIRIPNPDWVNAPYELIFCNPNGLTFKRTGIRFTTFPCIEDFEEGNYKNALLEYSEYPGPCANPHGNMIQLREFHWK